MHSKKTVLIVDLMNAANMELIRLDFRSSALSRHEDVYKRQGKNLIGCHSLEELVDNLEKPRKVFMMVKAGQAVDDMIEQLLPLLDDGDKMCIRDRHLFWLFLLRLGAAWLPRHA